MVPLFFIQRWSLYFQHRKNNLILEKTNILIFNLIEKRKKSLAQYAPIATLYLLIITISDYNEAMSLSMQFRMLMLCSHQIVVKQSTGSQAEGVGQSFGSHPVIRMI